MDPDDERAGPSGPDRPAPVRADHRRVRWLPVAIAMAAALVMLGAVVVVSDVVAGDTDSGSAIPPAADPAAPDSAATALRDSGADLDTVDCRPAELGPGRESARAYYEDVLACLDRAWRPVLDETGASAEPASVDLSETTSTACGPLPPADRALGLYCDSDRTIHLPYSRLSTAAGEANEPAYLATLAHEYGHHIQALTGVFAEAGNALSDASTSRESEVGRRLELQATCFAGLFLDAARDTSLGDAEQGPAAAVRDFANWSGVESHGGTRLQQRWASTGFTEASVAACDTWGAPASEIGGASDDPSTPQESGAAGEAGAEPSP
ncbi:neutral zinc metallopeptidase [Prauserella rugosa]|uniref:neutral zinc metallopeptidase n=1 Tax=Prauserella rugosa TaxID=43354 RepID=UPI00068C047F|nr:neutral zinc metallopeptidase [Prauserella rugosa]